MPRSLAPDKRWMSSATLLRAAGVVRACRASSPHLACWPHWAVPRCLREPARPALDSRALLACRSVGPARSAREEAADVRCAIGLLGRAAAGSGRLCHGMGATGGASPARWRGLELAMLSLTSRRSR